MKSRILLVIMLFVFMGQEPLLACAGGPPNVYLPFGRELLVLDMPEANFHHEILKINGEDPALAPADPGIRDLNKERLALAGIKQYDASGTTYWEKTLLADVADCEMAIRSSGLENEAADPLIDAYRRMRRSMCTGEKAEDGVYRLIGEVSAAFELDRHITLLDSVPREFALYLRGAYAYRKGMLEEARRFWEELLNLPTAERRYRSTWASFMLGKYWLPTDPAAAIRYFEQTRQLAREDFQDSLGLSLESLGWQIRAESKLEDPRPVIHHCMQLLPRDDYWYNHYEVILRYVCAREIRSATLDLNLATDPLCRRILTLWAISHQGMNWHEPNNRWLDLVAAHPLTGPEPGADRLAWAAYAQGRLDLAERWLKLADAQSPYAKWVRAKLWLREGRVEEAVKLLAETAPLFPKEESWIVDHFHDIGPQNEVRRELGILLLGRSDYISAFDALLRSHYWLEASYVADRVLTLDELKQYVRDHEKDEALNIEPVDRDWCEWDGTLIERLRYLLARRLIRQGLYEEAKNYLPPDVLLTFNRYLEGIAKSKDKQNSKLERAAYLIEAASLARYQGMEMMGVECEPDWFSQLGIMAYPGAEVFRITGTTRPGYMLYGLPHATQKSLSASKSEKDRYLKSAPRPDKRFHYRFLASDLMWQGAQLLPDNDPRLARTLYWGGSFIKNQDPDRANRFYKALVRRCRKLPIGQEADRLRWFPKTPPE